MVRTTELLGYQCDPRFVGQRRRVRETSRRPWRADFEKRRLRRVEGESRGWDDDTASVVGKAVTNRRRGYMTSHGVMVTSRFGAAGPPRHLQADTPVTWVTKNFK